MGVRVTPTSGQVVAAFLSADSQAAEMPTRVIHIKQMHWIGLRLLITKGSHPTPQEAEERCQQIKGSRKR